MDFCEIKKTPLNAIRRQLGARMVDFAGLDMPVQYADLMAEHLAARDTLRLEVEMSLYGHEIDDTTTVLEADLGWICKFDKGDFIEKAVPARVVPTPFYRRKK